MKKLFHHWVYALLLSLSFGVLPFGCCNQQEQPNCPDGICPIPEEPAPPAEPVPPVEPPEFRFKDYLKATCRVRISGSGGSGTCFKIDDNYVYILTCRHVVGSNGKGRSARVEFWANGSITGIYTGKVTKVFNVDAAVIVVPVSDFQGNEIPLAIPVSNVAPQKDDVIVSVGCLGLAWQSLVEGHVTGYSGKSFTFVPKPGGGRSGSGIFIDGKIVGVLWGAGTGIGYAVSCADLKELWDSPDNEPENPGTERPPCPHCPE